MDSPLKIYIDYCEYEIDGWDVMAWAVQLDAEQIEDQEALNELIELEDFYANGNHEYVEKLLHQVIPEQERKSKEEILFLDAFEKYQNESREVGYIIQKFREIFHDDYFFEQVNPDLKWAYNIYQENNGFSWQGREEDMSKSEIIKYFQDHIESEQF